MGEEEAIDRGEQNRIHPGRMLGIGMANIAILAWSINVVLGRWLRPFIGPFGLSAARYLIASLFFALIWKRMKQEDRRLGGDGWIILGMALSGVVAFSPILYFGLRFTAAVNATLILSLSPFITGLLATLLIRAPMTRRQIAGGLISLTGIVILISGGSPAFWKTMHGNVGDLIVLGAVSLWGLYSVLGQKVMDHRSSLSTSALSILLGLPFLLMASAWEVHRLPFSFSVEVVSALLFIGIFSTVIAYVSWNIGVSRLGASGAMVFYNMMPLYGALLGYFFLGEVISSNHLLGGVLIVTGGVTASTGQKKEIRER